MTQAHNRGEEGFEDLEAAWHPSDRTGQMWAEEFPKEEEFEASLINDPELQSSKFMEFVNKMSSGELSVNSEGKLVPFSEGQKMANEFLGNEPSWADQFEGGRNWAEQFEEGKGWAEQFGEEWSKEFLQGDWEERDLLNQYKEVYDKIQFNSDSQYNFQGDNQYLEDPDALKKGIEFF